MVVQYVRNPITCWAPVHFTGAHVKFMTSYCWVKNTYYVPWSKPIPKFDSDFRQMVPYYPVSYTHLTLPTIYSV